MERITTIGLDIAKQVFQVHGIDGVGAVVIRRKLRRDDVVGYFKALPPCLIGIEACATGLTEEQLEELNVYDVILAKMEPGSDYLDEDPACVSTAEQNQVNGRRKCRPLVAQA